jgi:hypothetical protein
MILFLKKLRGICFAPQCSAVIVHVLNIRFFHGPPLHYTVVRPAGDFGDASTWERATK